MATWKGFDEPRRHSAAAGRNKKNHHGGTEDTESWLNTKNSKRVGYLRQLPGTHSLALRASICRRTILLAATPRTSQENKCFQPCFTEDTEKDDIQHPPCSPCLRGDCFCCGCAAPGHRGPSRRFRNWLDLTDQQRRDETTEHDDLACNHDVVETTCLGDRLLVVAAGLEAIRD